jgi:hypothetical protein
MLQCCLPKIIFFMPSSENLMQKIVCHVNVGISRLHIRASLAVHNTLCFYQPNHIQHRYILALKFHCFQQVKQIGANHRERAKKFNDFPLLQKCRQQERSGSAVAIRFYIRFLFFSVVMR